MFGEEVRKLLIQVVTSWQVLVVTGILVVYIFLVNYVAAVFYRPRRSNRPSRPRVKSGSQTGIQEGSPGASHSEADELGLEEETEGKK